MNVKKPNVIFALVIVVAFFLPSVSVGGIIEVSGFNALKALRAASNLASSFGGEPSGVPGYLYGLYLIPISAGAVLTMEMNGSDTKALSLAAGALPCSFSSMPSSRRALTSWMGWVSVLISPSSVASAFWAPVSGSSDSAGNPPPRPKGSRM